jgi:hypothetical protein
MSWLKAVLRETYGLFVDDGRYVSVLIVWLLLIWLVLRRWPIFGRWSGVVLFAGLGLMMVESAVRAARRNWAKEKNRG